MCCMVLLDLLPRCDPFLVNNMHCLHPCGMVVSLFQSPPQLNRKSLLTKRACSPGLGKLLTLWWGGGCFFFWKEQRKTGKKMFNEWTCTIVLVCGYILIIYLTLLHLALLALCGIFRCGIQELDWRGGLGGLPTPLVVWKVDVISTTPEVRLKSESASHVSSSSREWRREKMFNFSQ